MTRTAHAGVQDERHEADRPGQAGGRREAAGGRADERVRTRLAERVGDERVRRYFDDRRARLCAVDGGVDLMVRDRMTAELIDRCLSAELGEAVRAELGEAAQLRVRVEPGAFAGVRDEAGERAAAEAARNEQRPGTPGRFVHEGPRPARRHAAGERREQTLETFLVGSSNRLAYEAAVRMGDPHAEPGFGMLLVHGVCGVGKTHLVHGIAARYRAHKPGARVRVTSAEEFLSGFVRAVRDKKVDAFQRMHRGVELLIVDDAHMLAGRGTGATEHEFMLTLEALQRTGARIVLATDRPPQSIDKLPAALRSRLAGGLVAGIEAPEQELRVRIAHQLAARRGVLLTDEAARQVSARAAADGGGTAREIEGLVTQAEALWRLDGAAGGSIDAASVLRAATTRTVAGGGLGGGGPVRLDRIVQTVCAEVGVEAAEFRGDGRSRRVVLARMLCVWLAKKMTAHSYPEIARAIGRPNHSTVITQMRRAEKAMASGEVVGAGCAYDGLSCADAAERLERLVRSGA